MSTALYPLRNVQIGLEATAGTAVAATFKPVGEIVLTEEIDREFETFPRGVRAAVTGGGYDIRHGTMVNFSDMNLTWEEVIIPMLTGIVNDAAPTGTGPYTWDFTPVLTAAAALKAATVEYTIDDGSTKHLQREMAYGTTQSIEFRIVANQIAKMNFEMALRKSASTTETAGQAVITGRTPVPSNLFALYSDSSWANLGNTAVPTTIRDATLRITTGATPDYTLDGRTSLDFTQLNAENLAVSLDMTLEFNAAAATAYSHFRGASGAGTTRFYRLEADNGLATTSNRKITFDLCAKHVSPPQISQDNGMEIVSLSLEGEYDATGTAMFVCTVINALSAQP